MDAKLNILKKYNISELNMLGMGMEAEVYAYGTDRVLKIYNGLTNTRKQETLKAFYDALRREEAGPELPRTYSILQEEGRVVTMEKRISGKSLQDALPAMTREQQEAAMKHYLMAQLQLQKITIFPPLEGYKLFSDNKLSTTRQKDWYHFLKQYIMIKHEEAGFYFARDVEQYEEKLQRLLSLLSSDYDGPYSLIHGDYYPGNVLVDDEGKVTGVIDFGIMTMYGDPLFDIACGWLYFDMYNVLEANLTERYLNVIMNTLGEGVRGRLYLYVLVNSILTANLYSQQCNDGHYLWCVGHLNNPRYLDGMANFR
ncbi:aminoglycoside phosphotransferase family protein [Marinicrinis lubricantis]|uniref:Aminoglycoside phosphotransferase family protein n=1 Tax=Marinicrinis lubricantis TaxID=2086470 RepID=A0ABW1IKK9_9BACL